jgi:hypothetical protein
VFRPIRSSSQVATSLFFLFILLGEMMMDYASRGIGVVLPPLQ